MAESMTGLKRTCMCAEVTEDSAGKTVTVMGWVNKIRNKGGIIFADLRDRSGMVQVVFEEGGRTGLSEKAARLKSEYVAAVVGEARRRRGAANEKMATGNMEIEARELRILSEALTPPFPVGENSKTKEELRLRHRYIDLRRPDLQRIIAMRSRAAAVTRRFFAEEGFLEIETPILGKSTPEGARDYLVPSRIHPGCFYGLPQSPQLFKQLLMCSGFDRYFQLAKCFRDEDLRSDRQPEFTQIDMELSFVGEDEVMEVNGRFLARLFKDVLDIEVPLPIPSMTWQEAMDLYGTDKPDIRFGMKIEDVTDTVGDFDFKVFKDAIESGGTVRGINAKGQASISRKKIDALTEYAKGFGAKGLCHIALQDGGAVRSSFARFMTEEQERRLIGRMGAQEGDLLLFAADNVRTVREALGSLRLKIAEQAGLLRDDEYKFVWVTRFPLLEWSDEEGRFKAMHHPFTMPVEEDLKYMDSDPGKVRSRAYDIVLNGNEIGGGSVRIHRSDIQEKMFDVLGLTKEEAYARFGFLLDAFRYGVPPHAGLAYGFDRLVMLMAKTGNIRDVIAFPKAKDASCLMTSAPDNVDIKQLKELGLKI